MTPSINNENSVKSFSVRSQNESLVGKNNGKASTILQPAQLSNFLDGSSVQIGQTLEIEQSFVPSTILEQSLSSAVRSPLPPSQEAPVLEASISLRTYRTKLSSKPPVKTLKSNQSLSLSSSRQVFSSPRFKTPDLSLAEAPHHTVLSISSLKVPLSSQSSSAGSSRSLSSLKNQKLLSGVSRTSSIASQTQKSTLSNKSDSFVLIQTVEVTTSTPQKVSNRKNSSSGSSDGVPEAPKSPSRTLLKAK